MKARHRIGLGIVLSVLGSVLIPDPWSWKAWVAGIGLALLMWGDDEHEGARS